jgi:hypothetical protein
MPLFHDAPSLHDFWPSIYLLDKVRREDIGRMGGAPAESFEE